MTSGFNTRAVQDGELRIKEFAKVEFSNIGVVMFPNSLILNSPSCTALVLKPEVIFPIGEGFI